MPGNQFGGWSAMEFQLAVCGPQRRRLWYQLVRTNCRSFRCEMFCSIAHCFFRLLLIFCDNSTAIAYVNNLGRIKLQLCMQFPNLVGNGVLQITVCCNHIIFQEVQILEQIISLETIIGILSKSHILQCFCGFHRLCLSLIWICLLHVWISRQKLMFHGLQTHVPGLLMPFQFAGRIF